MNGLLSEASNIDRTDALSSVRGRPLGTDRSMLKLLRLYCRRFPAHKGKARVVSLLFRLIRHGAAQMIVTSRDGRKFHIRVEDRMARSVLLFGEHEPFETRAVSQVVRKGDVVIDAGGGIGWYTTLFSRLVGEDGSVHTFEPVPTTFEKLRRNCRLNRCHRNVVLNRLALGRESGPAEIHVFAGLPDGHASLSTLGRTDGVAYACTKITLDEYLQQRGIDHVDFVKCDVEGSEMAVLEGSASLLSDEGRPMWLMEIAPERCVCMGHTASEVVSRLRSFGYEVFEVCRRKRATLKPVQDIERQEKSLNVLCLLPGDLESRARCLRVRGR